MQETGQTGTAGKNTTSSVNPAPTGIMTDVIMSALSNAPVLSEAKTQAVEYLEQFQDLKIVDTETYKSAKAYFSEIRATRLELSKKFAGVTTTLKSLVKDYDAQAIKVVALYQSTETAIRAEIQRVDDEKRAEKEKAEREAAQRFMERTDRLFESGYTFNGYLYTCGTIFLDSDKIQDLPDDEFAAMVEKGRIESERIAAILAASDTKGDVDLVVIQGEPEEIVVQVGFDPPVENPGDWFGAPVAELPKISELPVTGTGPEIIVANRFAPFPEPDPSFRPPGFTAGYDACKKAVLEILSREQKFTRVELVGLITELKA